MNDNSLFFLLGSAFGAACGVALEKLVFPRLWASSDNQSGEEALKNCFGEPMVTTTLTLSEVRDWIQARKDLLVNGTKAVVAKVDEETMKSLGERFDLRKIGNYLILAIMKAPTKGTTPQPGSKEGKRRFGDDEMVASLLIKYEKLDQELESLLAKGNGVLVVKG